MPGWAKGWIAINLDTPYTGAKLRGDEQKTNYLKDSKEKAPIILKMNLTQRGLEGNLCFRYKAVPAGHHVV